MISKYLFLIKIFLILTTSSSQYRQSSADQLFTDRPLSTINHVNRFHRTSSSQIQTDSTTNNPSIKSSNASTSKVQIHYCPLNCTCVSLDDYNRKHNDSEFNLTNHCLYLNLTGNKNQFKLYQQFHPFQLHQISELNLNYNNLTSLNEHLVLNAGHNQTIERLSFSHNRLTRFPKLRQLTSTLRYLNLDHNLISLLAAANKSDAFQLRNLIWLNLNHNRIKSVKRTFLRPICNRLKYVDLSSNRLARLDDHLFVYCKQLEVLKLNKNKLNRVGSDVFENLTNLVELDLSRNNLTNLTINFRSLINLKILNLSKNQLQTVANGTFEHLTNLQTLNLNENNLTYLEPNLVRGLRSLRLLQLSSNQIKQIDVNWLESQNLVNLYLERNQIDQLHSRTFDGLVRLEKLYLDYNLISSIDQNAFRTNENLIWLFLNDNYLNRLVDENRTLFVHHKLQYLALENNHLTYIPNQLFANLTSLVTIDLSLNQIKYIEENALRPLTRLDELNFDSTDLDCDCAMKWFVNYYQERSIENIYLEQLECKTPKSLANKAFIDVNINLFLCKADFKHYFLKEPKKQIVRKGQQFELQCKVVTNSFINEDIVFDWRKNNQTIYLNNERDIVEIMKLYKDKDYPLNHKLIYSSYLHFLNASLKDEGEYECIANNTYGSIKSQIAKIVISKPPEFVHQSVGNHLKVQKEKDIRIDCQTTGDPVPELSLAKNGQNFTLSIKRRIQFDKFKQQFIIKNATLEDKGLYTCMAINKLGKATKNIIVDILYAPYFEQPVKIANRSEYFDEGQTILINCSARSNPKAEIMLYKDELLLETDLNDRYYLKSDNQILLIKNSRPSDSGFYTCSLRNKFGDIKLSKKVEILTAEQAKLNYLYNNRYLILLLIVLIVCSICLVKIILIFILKKLINRFFGRSKKRTPADDPYPAAIKVLNNGQIDVNLNKHATDEAVRKPNDFSSKYLSKNCLPKDDPDCVTKLISYKKVHNSLDSLTTKLNPNLIKLPVKKVQFKLDDE